MESAVKPNGHFVFLKPEPMDDIDEHLPEYSSNITVPGAHIIKSDIVKYEADVCKQEGDYCIMKVKKEEHVDEVQPEYVDVLIETFKPDPDKDICNSDIDTGSFIEPDYHVLKAEENESQDETKPDRVEILMKKENVNLCVKKEEVQIKLEENYNCRSPGTDAGLPSTSAPNLQVSIKEYVLIKKRQCRRGQALTSAEKNAVWKAYEIGLKEKPSILISHLVDKISARAGISVASVYRIIRENKSTHRLSSPKRRKPRKTLLNTLNDCERTAIRTKVEEFRSRNEIASIDKILETVNEDPALPIFKRTTFCRLMKSLNLKYIKRGRDSVVVDNEQRD